jgi:3-methyl-2-oxobutanoate hydroxymethyltransferase
MGHRGLTPQSATILGGYKAQGRSAEKALRLYDDARALEAAGCFSLVLEAVPSPVATRITRDLAIPTIGIGAGPDCDGQVLVWHDILGLYEGRTARFVKRYAEIGTAIREALSAYADDVRERRFPETQHTYSMPDEARGFESSASDHHEHAERHSAAAPQRPPASAASSSRERRERREPGARATTPRIPAGRRAAHSPALVAPPARKVSPP